MPPERLAALEREEQGSYAEDFSTALNRPELAIPELVVGPNGKGATRRYNVYRNNVTVSLIGALAAVFPAVKRITGDEFFRAMARFHIRESPPRSPLLLEYGRDFPSFIERYEYAKDLPWLADTARLERAWLDAYHAVDAEPLLPSSLAAFPQDRLGDLCFEVHPATRIVQSRYAALTIFSANRNPAPVGPIDASAPEDALITRPELDVVVRRIPDGGAAFLSALIEGRNLAEAAGAAIESAPCFDVGANIAGMLEAGAFMAARLGDQG